LDSVLLVGGMSQSPQVRRRVQEMLGVPVQTDVDPLGAPALGAALLGHSLAQAEATGKPGARVSEVLSAPIGVAESSGLLQHVLARNTRLPAEKSLAVQVQPGPVALTLFQGASPAAQENEFLGTVFLILERGGELQLHFSLSVDGTLALAATLPGGRRAPVTLDARDPGDAARLELIGRSPLGQPPAEEPQRPGTLLTGIRKLFGR
jgi:molecular chaperone DnaK